MSRPQPAHSPYAIRSIFDRYYQAGEGIRAQLLYAIFVTIIAVIATLWIGRAAQKAKGKEQQEDAKALAKEMRKPNKKK